MDDFTLVSLNPAREKPRRKQFPVIEASDVGFEF